MSDEIKGTITKNPVIAASSKIAKELEKLTPQQQQIVLDFVCEQYGTNAIKNQ